MIWLISHTNPNNLTEFCIDPKHKMSHNILIFFHYSLLHSYATQTRQHRRLRANNSDDRIVMLNSTTLRCDKRANASTRDNELQTDRANNKLQTHGIHEKNKQPISSRWEASLRLVITFIALSQAATRPMWFHVSLHSTTSAKRAAAFSHHNTSTTSSRSSIVVASSHNSLIEILYWCDAHFQFSSSAKPVSYAFFYSLRCSLTLSECSTHANQVDWAIGWRMRSMITYFGIEDVSGNVVWTKWVDGWI